VRDSKTPVVGSIVFEDRMRSMQLGVDEVRRLERDLAAANARIAEMEAYQCNQQCNLLASRDARIAELGTTAATVEHYQAMVTGMEAELAALKEAGRWHKASEKPTHGNHVLAINANGEMWLDFWYYHERRWFNESNGNHDDMTMWRELPNPPKEGE
jgi:hypothetical protein